MSMGQSDLRRDARVGMRAAKHIVIVGGGIAGLSAAWYLQQEAARHDLAIHYTIAEESSRWGGKVHTERVADFGDMPFMLEAGPDALLTYKPWAVTLARELGLEDHLVGGNPANSRTFVLHRGRLVPLPAGLQLLVPTKVWPFARSPLFSWRGKLRVAWETRIPPRRDAADESLADFVRRRFGREAHDTLAEPLMADVYNVSSSRQSIMATFPQYPALEARYGSVIRGSLAATRQRQSARSATPSPPFVSLDGGTQSLVDALLSKLTGDLRLRSAVDQVLRAADDSYQVVLADGSRLDADAVILATPARVSASLLTGTAPSASSLLGEIGYTSIGNAYLAFWRQDVSHPLDGYGVVIPRAEGRHIDGMSWTSSKWLGRAPDDYVLLRVFFGGPHTRDLLSLDDAALLAVVRAEVAALLGVRASPVFQRVYRWPDGYPQYEVGHLARVDAIEAALPAGIYVTGSAYRGIGVPDCVRQGQEAAGRAVRALMATPAPRLASIVEPPQVGR